MKIQLSDREPVSGPDGHLLRELVGLPSMNISKYSVAHVVAPAGSRVDTRQNQFDEIVLVISGRATVRRSHVSDELEPRDLLLIPSGTSYAIDVEPEADFEFWAICVPAFRPEWSREGGASRDWRDYQVPRGADRLRPRDE